jgi:hypothetical protein
LSAETAIAASSAPASVPRPTLSHFMNPLRL